MLMYYFLPEAKGTDTERVEAPEPALVLIDGG
jgi:hypothetical protein